MERDYLFHSKGQLRAATQNILKGLADRIGRYELGEIAEGSEADLIEDNRLVAPEIQEDRIEAAGHAAGSGFSGSNVSLTVIVPFTGDGGLFHYQPSTHYAAAYPYGEVVGQEIRINYEGIGDQKEFENEYRHNVNMIKDYLGFVKTEVDEYNKSLERLVTESIVRRKKVLQGSQELIEKIGIPIRHRDSDDIPIAFKVPITRKMPKIAKPQVASQLHKPGPFLDEEEYENILEIMCSMSLAMERTPQVFCKLKEPQIRDFFLVFLNGHYGWEGQVAGETFNVGGKTDILIHYEGRNVFIAECKFWEGEKGLLNTIEQLFGYLTWRDTKTAILLFNRNKSFSGVLRQIDGIMKSQNGQGYRLKSANLQKFADLAAPEDRTIFSYKFCLPEDKDRELFLTVMAFDIPNKQKGAASELIEEIGQLSSGGNSVEDIKKERGK